MAEWRGMQYFCRDNEGIREQSDRDLEIAVDLDKSEHVYVCQPAAGSRSQGYQLYCYMPR